MTDSPHKTILITGATDGIGLETARQLSSAGHRLLVHGRSESKLTMVLKDLRSAKPQARVETLNADLSSFRAVEELADAVMASTSRLDVLINNAGLFEVAEPLGENGLDLRFMVNTLASYLLTKRLLPVMSQNARVVNLSSAAQAPVSLKALAGEALLGSRQAYAQSKLALTMWTFHMAAKHADTGIVFTAVNPGSLLASKMVKEAFGVAGKDLSVGAKILARAALAEEFAHANGSYFDNDSGRFADPHPDALDPAKNRQLVEAIETIVAAQTAEA